jgi:hypothetical protein
MLLPNILFNFAVNISKIVKNQYMRSVRGVYTCNLIHNKKMPVFAAHQKFLAVGTNVLIEPVLLPTLIGVIMTVMVG